LVKQQIQDRTSLYHHHSSIRNNKMAERRALYLLACVVVSVTLNDHVANSFVSPFGTTTKTKTSGPTPVAFVPSSRRVLRLAAKDDEGLGDHLVRVPEEEEGVVIPFLDVAENTFIDCYADSIANLGGVEYTIGVPCDYCVALCYFDEPDGNLVPVELNDALMDDIFPVAENIVMEEFGEELVLQRTPQTLTLVGELEEEEDEDEDEDEEDEDDEDSPYAGDEDVEVLLSFEHRGTEFNLVRFMDPLLLVAKRDPERPDMRNLLSPEESDKVMPLLEEMFLKLHSERDGNMAP
jgi:Protein of unknown function (DUF3727)